MLSQKNHLFCLCTELVTNLTLPVKISKMCFYKMTKSYLSPKAKTKSRGTLLYSTLKVEESKVNLSVSFALDCDMPIFSFLMFAPCDCGYNKMKNCPYLSP